MKFVKIFPLESDLLYGIRYLFFLMMYSLRMHILVVGIIYVAIFP